MFVLSSSHWESWLKPEIRYITVSYTHLDVYKRQGRTGYAYSESTDIRHLQAAARAAARIAESPAGDRKNIPFTPLKLDNYYSLTHSSADVDVFSKKGYLKEIHTRLSEADSRIVQIIGQSSSSLSKIMFFNSLGEFYCDERPLLSLIHISHIFMISSIYSIFCIWNPSSLNLSLIHI